ncbi:hypothetical protein F4779DRAFT_565904 [Xylariaceae sp. FL0662B]|nr:hypothetical protein F4779DRAFT_565904 [Xylariaceae sp. FL0662B]
MRASNVFFAFSGLLLIGVTHAAPAQHGQPQPDDYGVAKRWQGRMYKEHAMFIICLAVARAQGIDLQAARGDCITKLEERFRTRVEEDYDTNYPSGRFPTHADVSQAQYILQ